jgi:hypothetical protein
MDGLVSTHIRSVYVYTGKGPGGAKVTNSSGGSPWDLGPVGPTRGVVCHSGVLVFTDLNTSSLVDPSYVFISTKLSSLFSSERFPQIETSECLFF